MEKVAKEKIVGQEKGPKRSVKRTEYGKQLDEKQKVKHIYGMREKQFRKFFKNATKSKIATGDALLSMLETRLDNIVYRLKFASSRKQARQSVVHGHILVDGKRVSSPSYLVSVDQEVSLDPRVLKKTEYLAQVFDKRINASAKVPDWLELNKVDRKGKVLRSPIRTDIQMSIEDHLIVELYSK